MLLPTLVTCLFTLVPNHPSEILYPEYVFTPPTADPYHEELLNGVNVFIVEDRELPLIQMRATFLGGEHLESDDLVGLVGFTAELMRSGGTASTTAEEVDELLDFFAANIGVSSGRTSLNVSFDCLKDNFESAFDLFLDIIQNPRFQESRLHLTRDSYLENMKQRNDFPSGILDREFNSLMFGDSYLGREPTEETVSLISKEHLMAMHSTIVDPHNLVISVSGDFQRDEMLSFLEEKVGGWKGVNQNSPPLPVQSKYIPGIYYVHQDVPQGGVNIGLRTFRQGDPDVIAAQVMNQILGGGGFTSRITRRVRSDEGLSYSAGSSLTDDPWDDGVWFAYFESKNQTVALATKIILEEIDRIKTQLVTEEELELAKNSMVEAFPSLFQSKARTLGVFVNDFVTKRDPNYWTNYRNAIRGVTAEDVRRVANRLLTPSDMLVLIVGNWDQIREGDPEGRATMDDIQSVIGGAVTRLPVRDPMTLEVSQ